MVTETMTAAEMIAEELREVVPAQQLAAYVDDESGSDSLEYFRALVRVRLGGSYDSSAWDAAMGLLRGDC